MKVRRRFLVALMVSILLHASVVIAPGRILPALDDWLHPHQAPSLDAWLQAPGKQPAPTPRPAKPRRAKPAQPTPTPNAAVAPDMPVPVVPDQAPAAEAAATEPEAPPAAAARSQAPEAARPAPGEELLSLHVRIQYSVTMGESGFVIGQSVEEIDNDGETYQMRTTTGTTGLARLFKRVDMVYTSIGDIVDGRLRPHVFTAERDGQPDVNAIFEWQQGPQVMVNERRYPIESGTQDLLSVFCELALEPITGPSVTLPVATGKKIERYEFSVIGKEQLSTPMGEQPTLHLRTVGTEPQLTEVWLGLNFARLPLRIRYVDRHGDLFDQTATRIEVKPNMERAH